VDITAADMLKLLWVDPKGGDIGLRMTQPNASIWTFLSSSKYKGDGQSHPLYISNGNY